MKSLEQVIHAVQYELDCSISELSRKLGKSRNYLSTTMSKGLSEEKEQALIEKLLSFIDDENAMLRRLLEDKDETITAYKVKLKEVINENLNEIEKKNKTISDLEHRIVVLSRNVDKGCEEVNKLNEVIATKDLFIDGQDKEIKDLEFRLNGYICMSDAQQEVIQNLKADIKHSEELVGIRSNQIDKQNKEIKDYNDLCNRQRKTIKETRENISRMELKHRIKNRILTGALIGVGLLLVVGLWVMK